MMEAQAGAMGGGMPGGAMGAMGGAGAGAGGSSGMPDMSSLFGDNPTVSTTSALDELSEGDD